jgi:hypothetical protein
VAHRPVDDGQRGRGLQNQLRHSHVGERRGGGRRGSGRAGASESESESDGGRRPRPPLRPAA